MMLRYVNGYIFEGHTFVVNKSDIHNAKDEQFAEGTALMPDGWISVEDRVPENYVPILFTVNDLRIGKKITRYGYKGERDYTAFEADEEILYMEIECWMPLPNPPKGDDED